MIAAHVDEMALMRSVYGRSNDHVQAHYELQTGMIRGLSDRGLLGDVRARIGESRACPGSCDLRPPRRAVRRTGQLERRIHAGRLPGHGVPPSGDPIIDLKPPADVTPDQQRARLDLLAKLNELHDRKVSRQLGAGGADLVVRARVPDAELRARSGGHEHESEAHQEALRSGQRHHGTVRQAVPDGAPPGRARRAIRAALPWRPGQSDRTTPGTRTTT